MKLKLLVVVFIAITSIGVQSCKKYDQGPALSLRSPKARLTGVWDLQKTITDGNTDDDTENTTYEFKDDDTFEVKSNGSTDLSGTWSFNSDKTVVNMTVTSIFSFTLQGKILKLTNKEMILSIDFFGSISEMHYEKK